MSKGDISKYLGSGRQISLCALCPMLSHAVIKNACGNVDNHVAGLKYPDGSYCPNPALASPFPCPAGTYPSGIASTACTCCTAGYFCEEGSCSAAPCAAGTFSAESSASCIAVPNGFYSNKTANEPSQCEAGHACQDASSWQAMKQASCKRGTFSHAGSSVCRSCAAGTFSDEDANRDCSPCLEGHHCPSGAADPVMCPAGSFARLGQASCIACPEGFYSDDQNVNCSACDNGYICPSQNTSRAMMKDNPCGPGTFSNAGQSKCTNCSAGTYTNGTVNSACDTCPLGHYCEKQSSIPIPCPEGTFRAVPGGSSAADCPKCQMYVLHTHTCRLAYPCICLQGNVQQ